MAFNPFNVFRRNQKVIFSALVVVAMAVFVVSSGVGGADLLNQLTDWVSNRRRVNADTAAIIDGKQIDQMTVEQVKHQRRLANTYVQTMVELSHQIIFNDILQQREKADPMLQQCISQYFSLQMFARQLPPDRILTQMIKLENDLRMARMTLDNSSAPNKNEQIRLVDNFYQLVDRQRIQFQKEMLRERECYFGGRLESTEDALDFIIWKKQADQLGVRMTPDDVNDAVRIEMLNQKPQAEMLVGIDRSLRQQFRGYSPDMLQHALADEFRVRTARTAILGEPVFTRTTPPVVATPEELFEWYQDVRTSIRVGLIELPVASFMDKVTDSPTDAQLKELFEKHKNDEYNPQLERPGFKDPRKVKIDWFSAPYDSGFYGKASEMAPLYSAVRQIGAVAATGDATPAAGLSTVLAFSPAVADMPLADLYTEFVQNSATWTSPIAFGIRSGLHDSSFVRPDVLATLVGSVIAAGATDSGPFSGPLAMESLAVFNEAKDRARIGATAILSAALDPAPLAIDGILSELIPKPLSEAAARPIIAARDRERLRNKLVNADITTFTAELAKRFKEDRNNVDAYINEFIQTRQLQRGGTKEPVDRYALPDDPGLAPLRTAVDRGRAFHTIQADPLGAQFAETIADGPRGGQKPALFQAQTFPTETSTLVSWRSEDKEPRAIPFDQAKPRVLTAWKFEKARQLAKAEAERLSTEWKGKNEMELRDLAMKANPRGLIDLPALAKLTPRLSFTTGAAPGYEQPRITQDKVKYPGNMVNEVVDLRKKSPGDNIIVTDQPKANYYIVAMLTKDVPSADAFRMVYRASMGPPQVRDPLFDIYSGERQERYRQQIMKQLREEVKLEVMPDQKKNRDEPG